MATISEDFVSFETAKLLKEKGFDGFCERFYDYYPETGEVYICGCDEHNNSRYDDDFSKPTLQMAMKWLREVHGLFISIGNDDLDYSWQIFDVRNRTKDLDPTCLTDSYAGYGKYEQACETAIKYCLENLI